MRRFPPYPKRPAGSSGQARITLGRKAVYLGVHGSPESWAKYRQLLQQWEAGALDPDPVLQSAPGARTVRGLVAAFWPAAELRYPPPADSRESSELANYREALRLLLDLHGDTPVSDFGPRALKTWLKAAAGRWCRRVANRHLGRLKTFWRWCESEELVTAGSSHAMATVRGLAVGEHGATERPEVAPAPEESIARALPQLNPIARALVEVLLLTAARPGELFKLTPADINRSGRVEVARGYFVELGGVWAVQPLQHKTARKGKRRVILFGPRAQAILAPLLDGRGPATPVFCPAEAPGARRTGRRPAKQRYDRRGLNQAVRRACVRAGVTPFTSYQLRHSAATRLASEYGQDLARVVLGHADLRTTAIYSLPDLQAAARALGETG